MLPRLCRLLVLGTALFLVPATAHAALEVRLSLTPAKPRVGAAVTVTVRPYWPNPRSDGSCCRLDPAIVDYPFRIQAVAPTGQIFRVRVRRSADPYRWVGTFVFPRPGRWQVRAANWGREYRHAPGARPRLRVVVAPR